MNAPNKIDRHFTVISIVLGESCTAIFRFNNTFTLFKLAQMVNKFVAKLFAANDDKQTESVMKICYGIYM